LARRHVEGLIEDAIRGDPEAPLRWVSRSQRNIAEALRRHGFQVSRKLVGRLLREQQYSCQANRKTREGSLAPDSALEEGGFEPSVPQQIRSVFETARRVSHHGLIPGTDGSNRLWCKWRGPITRLVC
jgi:hypothetical protein